jgi:hypothetical protein
MSAAKDGPVRTAGTDPGQSRATSDPAPRPVAGSIPLAQATTTRPPSVAARSASASAVAAIGTATRTGTSGARSGGSASASTTD